MMTKIICVPVSEHSLASATQTVMEWGARGESRFVCVANVHMLMEGYDSSEFRDVLETADLVVPDGMPLVWMMRLKGARHQERVYGPALVSQLLADAADRDLPVGFYGSTPHVLDAMFQRAIGQHPDLQVACLISPPFRELRVGEDIDMVQQITESGARILFVGLGCPKQERWMAAHRGRIPAVMIGVGAAFDFLAGTKPMAPGWMQTLGLEWLFRLISEPRRLWRRYLYHNTRFVALAVAELLGTRRS